MFYAVTMALYLLGIILPGLLLDKLSNSLGGSDLVWGLVALLAVVALVV